MTVKYKTVITKAGAVKLAAATIPNGKKVNLTAMAIGDGGGTLPVPDPNQTKLIKEVWRHALNKISQDKKNKNYVVAELLIPPETGGFWMREMGLYDDTGTLIAVGNMAESYKPALAEGSGRAQTVRMVIMVSDIESVELTIDTSTVMATQDYVDDKIAEHEQSRRHPDATLTAKGFTQLSSATDSTSETLAATPKAVKVAYDLAKAKYTAQDATTAQKGIVQLSSATDSSSEVLAATPKAVKAAYDLAKGKYTAQDATTAQKGIVQLSSATDSSSEVLAATPKAVKSVNDSLTELKKSLGTAAVKDAQTSKDDVTAGRLLVNGGAIAVRTVAAKADGAGNNVNDANNLPANSVSFLYPTAGNSAGINGSLLSFSGLSGNYPVQITASYNDGKNIKFRTYNGDAAQKWNPWYDIYHSGNKPTAADVNAIPLTGSNEVKGVVRNAAEFQSTSANSYRIVGGGYGTFWRNDGNNLYLMLTNKDDAYGSYNALRPLWVNLETGSLQSGAPLTVNNTINAGKDITAGYSGAYAWAEQYTAKAAFYNSYSTTGTSEYHPVIKQQATVTGKNSWAFSMGSLVAGAELSWHLHMKGSGSGEVNYKWDVNGNFTAPGQIFPGSFANFDSRYYTKSQSDAGYMPKTGAYTKAESDGRYQPKGSYAAPDTSGISGNIIWWKNTATGVITMMGQTTGVANSGRVTFPFAFPSKCFGVIPTRNNSTGQGAAMQPYDVNTTGWNLRIAGGGTETVMWTAMGK
ncbi:phage tail-collar fiber domain-containing protein [Enterobacter sp. P82]|uniref:phage tail-collar fiber domain-containing protein n=1 Tax=Enterobacter sp. P82 TaxID=3123033 RepID=UPI00300C2972